MSMAEPTVRLNWQPLTLQLRNPFRVSYGASETRRAFSRTFDYQTYLWAALVYLVIVELLRNLWNWLENRLTRHLKR